MVYRVYTKFCISFMLIEEYFCCLEVFFCIFEFNGQFMPIKRDFVPSATLIQKTVYHVDMTERKEGR